jgi:hypothetical protein
VRLEGLGRLKNPMTSSGYERDMLSGMAGAETYIQMSPHISVSMRFNSERADFEISALNIGHPILRVFLLSLSPSLLKPV